MKKLLITTLFFLGLWVQAQVQALSLGKSLLGGLSGGNQEMVAYLRSMDEKITSMEIRNKNKEFREKTKYYVQTRTKTLYTKYNSP